MAIHVPNVRRELKTQNWKLLLMKSNNAVVELTTRVEALHFKCSRWRYSGLFQENRKDQGDIMKTVVIIDHNKEGTDF